MYSIVEIKGKQYQVKAGETVDVDRIDAEANTAFDEIKVLMHKSDDGKFLIGSPYLENVKISASVVEEFRDDKIMVIKYKPKGGYTKRHGHRQKYTTLKINSINVA